MADRLLRPAVVVVSSGSKISPSAEIENVTEDKENIQGI
jgi:hypothetical protein